MKTLLSKLALTIITLLACSIYICGQTAQEVINNSIAYHDPEGKLSSLSWKMYFDESRPDNTIRKSTFQLNPQNMDFEAMRTIDEKEVRLQMYEDVFTGILDDKSDFSEEEATKYRINKDRALMMRDYYHYLWCMPMKLLDPGTKIDEDIKTVDFFGQKLLQIKVTYDEAVGNDIWYFYFDTATFAMKGYRFYHDEAVNDGEYILLTDEYEIDNVRLPKNRAWYTHKEQKFLGEDRLMNIEFELPYYEIPNYPDHYSACTVVARMLDGLGFRYYWATEGLRDIDLEYKPSEDARTTSETIDHLLGLTEFVLRSVLEGPNVRSEREEMDFAQKRSKTLLNIKKAADIMRTSDDLSKFKIVMGQGDNISELPFWNQINGPIADALWHCGQVVSFRRSSGNPYNSKASVFSGKVRK